MADIVDPYVKSESTASAGSTIVDPFQSKKGIVDPYASSTSNVGAGGSARGTVVAVHDADTVTIKDETGHNYNLRFAKVDAPELKQKYGAEAQKYLSSKVLNKQLDFNWDRLDEHGRYVGNAKLDGEDIGLDLVKGGYAHHYSRYDNSPDYAAAYTEAFNNKLGLWKDDKHPQAPEAFRRDAEDPTGWKRFKFKELHKSLGREAGALVDTIYGIVPMIVNVAGLTAETLAPLVGKDPKSVSRETDKLIEQISDPIRKLVGGKQEVWNTTGVHKTLMAFNDNVLEPVADPIADATNMTPRQRAVFKDTLGIVAAELTGGLLGKTGIKDRVVDSMTTPTAKERATYLEKKATADKDFQFYQEQKLKDEKAKTTSTENVADYNDAVAIEINGTSESIKGQVSMSPDAGSWLSQQQKANYAKQKAELKEAKTYEEQQAINDKYQTLYEQNKETALEASRQQVHPSELAAKPKEIVDPETGEITVVEPKKPSIAEQDRIKDEVWELGRSTAHNEIKNKLGQMSDKGLESFITIQTKRLANKDKPIKGDLRDLIQAEIDLAKEHQKARAEGKEPPLSDINKPDVFDDLDPTIKKVKEEPITTVEETKPIVEESKPTETTKPEESVKVEQEPILTPDDAAFSVKVEEVIKDPSEARLNEFFKLNEKELKWRGEQYMNGAGINPVLPDYKAWNEMIYDAIHVDTRKVIYGNHEIKSFVKAMYKITKSEAELSRTFEAIQRKTVNQLPEHLQLLAKLWENTMKRWGKEFVDAGMLRGLLDDYASRIVDFKGVDPKAYDAFLKAFEEKMQPQLVTGSRFQKSRLIENYDVFLETLAEHGLKLKTTNLVEVARIYGQSMFKATADKALINYLKEFNPVDGFKVLMDVRKGERAPYNYKRITGGQFDGYAVHPAIYPGLRFVLDSHEMPVVFRALHSLSMVTKRLNVAGSLFHGMTLLVGKAFALSAKDNNYFNPVAQYKGLVEAYDKAFESGRLKQWNDRGGNLGAEADAGRGAIKVIGQSVDNWLQKTGGFEGNLTTKTIDVMSKPQHLLDTITWDIIHDGSKLLSMEALLEKAMRDHPNKTEATLMTEIARHTNDVYGGIDWFDAARDSNKFLERIKMSVFSPAGLKYFQIFEFAPDWTLSTLRVATRAVPRTLLQPHKWNIAEGLAGLQKPLTAADHARRYQMRAMMYLMTVANALNISLSGHDLFDNKDFFSIELGDGSAIHPFKHYSEVFHWLGDFNKTATNKLGTVPRIFVKTADKSWEESWKEAAKSIIPFSVSGATKGVPEAVGGFIGVPVTGKHDGSVGGSGIAANWEKYIKRAEKRLGVKITNEPKEIIDPFKDK